MHALALDPATTALLVVDVQERLVAAMPDAGESCVGACARLLEGMRVLGVPVIVTEQYPKGLGPTAQALRDVLATFDPPAPVYEKLAFGACGDPPFAAALDARIEAGLRAIVVCGMEAHVCVYQTVRALAARGLRVHVALDAVASRDPRNLEIARGLWAASGAIVTSTETVLFDLMGQAGTETFKAVSRIVK
jgi:nicotinamidase-related amidase